jgi:hypothetical protein
MYTQVGDHFAYSIPQGGLYVPGGAQAAVGMRYGPLKYALQRLERQSGADAGETRLDAHCVRFVTRPPALPAACLSLYRRALRDLHATHVAVVAYGAPSVVSANARFFERLLGRATSRVGATLIFSTGTGPSVERGG